MPTEEKQLAGGLAGRKVLFGVTGGIAAYKVAGWVRNLTGEGAGVTVVMTAGAERFVSALTFTALSGNRVYTDMFAGDPESTMAHITLAREADVILIAPATANTIARLAHGLADDLLSTTVLAAAAPVVVCPAMNSQMLVNRATQDNIQRLRELGHHVVSPAEGSLACGEEGPGRLPEWETAREELLAVFANQDLRGQKILITAGPTREPLDPARYISNRSSGKMGYALARAARRRGAEVILVSGPVALAPPVGVETVPVVTAGEMHEAVMRLSTDCSIIVKAAAVADFRPAEYEGHKIKKSGGISSIQLIPNVDILAELGARRRQGQQLVGFAAESRNHVAEGQRKLREKNLDLIVVNDILGAKTGFDVETNQVTLIDKKESMTLPLLSKEETAERIWDRIIALGAAG